MNGITSFVNQSVSRITSSSSTFSGSQIGEPEQRLEIAVPSNNAHSHETSVWGDEAQRIYTVDVPIVSTASACVDMTVDLDVADLSRHLSTLGSHSSSTVVRIVHPSVILVETLERYRSGDGESPAEGDAVLRILVACYWLENDFGPSHGSGSSFFDWRKSRLWLEGRRSLGPSVDLDDRASDVMDRLETSAWSALQRLSQESFGHEVESAKLANLVALAYTGVPNVHPGRRPRSHSIITHPDFRATPGTRQGSVRRGFFARRTSHGAAPVVFTTDVFGSGQNRAPTAQSDEDDDVSPTTTSQPLFTRRWPSLKRHDSAFSPAARSLFARAGSLPQTPVVRQGEHKKGRSRSISSVWNSARRNSRT
ncbi:hypothetical protein JCM11491_001291 [Sporobolomyces phaffii]